MSAPQGELTILREYSCGCIVYQDEARQEHEERGLFCAGWTLPGFVFVDPDKLDEPVDPSNQHKRTLVKGQESQDTLFA